MLGVAGKGVVVNLTGVEIGQWVRRSAAEWLRPEVADPLIRHNVGRAWPSGVQRQPLSSAAWSSTSKVLRAPPRPPR